MTHLWLVAIAAIATLPFAACGGDDTSALRDQVAALQTQIAQQTATTTVEPTLTAAPAAPTVSTQPRSTGAAGANAPRFTEAAVIGALREHKKESRVCEVMFGAPLSQCTVDLYIRAFCNFDSSATKLPIKLEFVLSATSNQPWYKATWDTVQSRWDVQAGCRTGPNMSAVYRAWYFEDRREFVGADDHGVSMLN